MIEIARIVKCSERLVEISISNDRCLSSNGINQVAQVIRCHNLKIQKIKLSNVGSRTPFIKCFGDYFFSKYSKLYELRMTSTAINDADCALIAQGLHLNHALLGLFLDNNKITDTSLLLLYH